MKKIFGTILAAAMLFVGDAYAAQQCRQFENTSSTASANLLEGVAMNAAEASRTATVNTGNVYRKLRVAVFFTYSAATAVTVQFKCSIDGTNYATLQTRDCLSGTCSDYDWTDSKDPDDADADYLLEYDAGGCDSVQLVVGSTGGGASDTFNLQAAACK
jgi:hypothetical protein